MSFKNPVMEIRSLKYKNARSLSLYWYTQHANFLRRLVEHRKFGFIYKTP